jgi:hypothetical protein
MLVKLLSDLHLGYSYPMHNYVDHGERVCVLAGDISTGMTGVLWAEAEIPAHIQVIYVPGNHEYYGQDYTELNLKYKEYNNLCTHVTILNNNFIEVDGREFYGTPLWTDFGLYGVSELSGEKWRKGLNDSVYIKDKGAQISAESFISWHAEALKFLARAQPAENSVLVTHYCPDLSISFKYRDHPLTPGFASKIPQELHKKFAYHFHGHTHTSMNYEYSYGTKVRCNPKGYGEENSYEFNDEMVMDI